VNHHVAICVLNDLKEVIEPEYAPFLKTFANQEEFTKQRLENKIYELN